MKVIECGSYRRILHCKDECGWFSKHILTEHLYVCPNCGSSNTFSVGRYIYELDVGWFGLKVSLRRIKMSSNIDDGEFIDVDDILINRINTMTKDVI
jgi:hypothetical protein